MWPEDKKMQILLIKGEIKADSISGGETFWDFPHRSITNMKRDTFLPSLSTLLIFGMTVFLSCAHQNRVDDMSADDAGAQGEQAAVTEEGSVAPAEGSASNELSDLTTNPDAAATTDGATADTSKAAAENQDLAALGTDDKALESLTPPTDAQKVDGGTAGALSTPGADAAAATPPATSGASDLDPLTTLGTDLGTESATAGAVAATNNNDAAATPPPTEAAPVVQSEGTGKNDTPITTMSPIFSAEGESKPKHHQASFSGTSRVPKIPSKAVTRAGTKLNRFYFARSGDNAESVSTLIYGSGDHAKMLTKWNGHHWKPGNLVYYQSPTDAGESKMRSFYQEKNVQPEEYTISRGDWLSKVAKAKLGASGSWKEIAVVNGMETPDNLVVGSKIAIYPRDLSGASGTRVAEEAPKEEPKPIEQPVAQNKAPQVPQGQAQPADPSQDLANQVPPPQQPQAEQPRPVQKQPAVDASKVVEQNLPAVFILGGVLVLSALYLMVRRRKSAKPLDEFADDNFAPPTKLKRK